MKGMVQIKPLVDSSVVCIGNRQKIRADAICWLGIHVGVDRQLKAFCEDYDSIRLSEAFSHSSRFQIEDYTRIQSHDFSAKQDLVTFIWREDRPWLPHYPANTLRKAGLHSLALAWQQRKVVKLFKSMKRARPDTRFAVKGLGKSGRFPDWIKDHRATHFDESSEISTAQLYADSRIVIGVHGPTYFCLLALPAGPST
jgi:hypothetical protein